PSRQDLSSTSSSTANSPARPSLDPLSLHDALPIFHHRGRAHARARLRGHVGRYQTGFRYPREIIHGRRGKSFRLRSQTHLGYARSEEHTSELQSRFDLVCRLLLEKKQYEP